MKVYEKVCEYYINQMKEGALKPGDKMPSIRTSEKILGVSRTSIETGFLQLAADGYIYSVEKVGYFVSDMLENNNESEEQLTHITSSGTKPYEYNLATIGEDKTVSCLNLWRRYMKSALRQEDRLLSYANNQGEYDLRQEIAAYVRKNRNIICSADDVVIGAGFQNLLQILIPLIPGEKTISFPTKDFMDGAILFKSAGFTVNFRDKESHVIYVTPSYMTKWGDVMPMKRRRELAEHVTKNNHLLIEDDYQNEFVYSSKPTPSLYAMTGGENVAFLGSFSRVLLPSVRISFLILPKKARKEYLQLRGLYNQTASKAEQIALAQFLRDGHLDRHIKKIKRLYDDKRNLMYEALQKHFSDNAEIIMGESGMEMAVKLKGEKVCEKIENSPVAVNVLETAENAATILISCSKIESENINNAIQKLNDSLQK
ncbi:MocR-like pyridoxine biosynthesis transcription factor PdxR [Pseudobutyrivibrio ruminis]|uniref:GntR family transcriptional regulator / MocR family aminotransferase n=1 Tax=Pseudobutyrivibrio ruminis DSM 9787 TaxID=1123011 RepID=A0A285SF27_9FIRM|nr:PLP-dependent aminotransferase family protein [Pseudobutyrivibrio ruminis]SOC06494.1 GntR family transcriptional regulator / MocR family aminotransferase [Pseudobutyrivibrio ruminis DSM 9787]